MKGSEKLGNEGKTGGVPMDESEAQVEFGLRAHTWPKPGI